MLTDLSHPDTRSARMGTLEHHGEQIRGKGRIRETGRLAKPYDALMRAKLVLLHENPRRMIRVGQLGEGVAKGRAALFHRAKLGRGTTAPILKLPFRISAVPGVESLPGTFFIVSCH